MGGISGRPRKEKKSKQLVYKMMISHNALFPSPTATIPVGRVQVGPRRAGCIPAPEASDLLSHLHFFPHWLGSRVGTSRS